MTRNNRVLRQYPLMACATLAAHSRGPFRQRDVKFLFQLFANWLEADEGVDGGNVQNTQIARFLVDLVSGGFAKTVGRTETSYRLTRAGLLELIRSIRSRNYRTQRHYFFFVFYFLSNYRAVLERLIAAEGPQFPQSIRLELEALLELRIWLNEEEREMAREMKKVQIRIDDALASSELAISERRRGTDLKTIAAAVEKLHPYELNSQKPLSELIESIPLEQQEWELTIGSRKRAEELWRPALTMLAAYRQELARLRETLGK